MKSLQEIKDLLQVIEDEVRPLQNTGRRVSEFGKELVDHLQVLYNLLSQEGIVHNSLIGRSEDDCHPINSIESLRDELSRLSDFLSLYNTFFLSPSQVVLSDITYYEALSSKIETSSYINKTIPPGLSEPTIVGEFVTPSFQTTNRVINQNFIVNLDLRLILEGSSPEHSVFLELYTLEEGVESLRGRSSDFTIPSSVSRPYTITIPVEEFVLNEGARLILKIKASTTVFCNIQVGFKSTKPSRFSFLFQQGVTIYTVTREELLDLINNNELTPNTSYRITDYTTTTAQTNTQSAGHDFDVIVTALSTNELSEDAKCVRKADDTYFANAKLEAWEIKYCINNDTSRFAWANTANGKGVIYYMKDEWGNECPYDFKNIQFEKLSVFLYTFGGTTDDSLTGACHHNIIMTFYYNSTLRLSYNTFGIGCYSNTFGTGCYGNTFGDSCFFNTFGNSCSSNTFGNSCFSNTFGNSCFSNTFSNSCYFNTFGNSCYGNTFGDSCFSNTFSNYFKSNTFGTGCYGNTFGNSCEYNTFGNDCYSNTFGNYCRNNNFYTGTTGTIKKNYIKYIVLEDGCSYNNFYSGITTGSASPLQRIRIKGLENTTATNTQITLSETNTNYEWVVAKNSSGDVKQYCPENLVP